MASSSNRHHHNDAVAKPRLSPITGTDSCGQVRGTPRRRFEKHRAITWPHAVATKRPSRQKSKQRSVHWGTRSSTCSEAHRQGSSQPPASNSESAQAFKLGHARRSAVRQSESVYVLDQAAGRASWPGSCIAAEDDQDVNLKPLGKDTAQRAGTLVTGRRLGSVEVTSNSQVVGMRVNVALIEDPVMALWVGGCSAWPHEMGILPSQQHCEVDAASYHAHQLQPQ